MRYAIWFCLTLLFSAPASAEKILLAGDPQYGWFGTIACKRERQNFQKIVDIVNEGEFNALIILGDLADSYPKRRGRRDGQVSLFLEDIKKIRKARVFYVAGNHDLGESPTTETIKRFGKNFGVPAWYAFRLGGYKFLVINTTLVRNFKRLPRLHDEQIEFMEKNKDARFVLGHHPMFYRNPREDDRYYNWPIRVRGYILSLFAPGTLFFSGHTHKPFQKTADGRYNINVGTCCAPIKKGGESYGVLEIGGGIVRYTEKTLQ